MACVPAALEEGRYPAQGVAGLTQGREAGEAKGDPVGGGSDGAGTGEGRRQW